MKRLRDVVGKAHRQNIVRESDGFIRIDRRPDLEAAYMGLPATLSMTDKEERMSALTEVLASVDTDVTIVAMWIVEPE